MRGWISWKTQEAAQVRRRKNWRIEISRGGSAELKPWCTLERCQPDKFSKEHLSPLWLHSGTTPSDLPSHGLHCRGISNLVAVTPFNLDQWMLLRNMRSATRAAAGGLSGMTVERFLVLLDMPRDARAFFQACEKLCRAQVPVPIRDPIRLGRLIALQEPNGGVRGIVVGDIVRRLVSRNVPTDDGEGASGHSSIRTCHGHLERLRMHRARCAGVKAGHAPGDHGFGWWQFSSSFSRIVFRHPPSCLWEDSCGRTHTIV